MSSTQEIISGHLAEVVAVAPAANADELPEHERTRATTIAVTSAATGWDAFEVWRKFIKEARDRRESHPSRE